MAFNGTPAEHRERHTLVLDAAIAGIERTLKLDDGDELTCDLMEAASSMSSYQKGVIDAESDWFGSDGSLADRRQHLNFLSALIRDRAEECKRLVKIKPLEGIMFGGNSAQHCEKANDYAEDLLWNINSFRRQVRSADESRKRDTAKTAIYNVNETARALITELRWVDETSCSRHQKFKNAVRSSNSFKEEMWEHIGSDLGFSPEFGNLWPVYLAGGSIAWWLWSARKARATDHKPRKRRRMRMKKKS